MKPGQTPGVSQVGQGYPSSLFGWKSYNEMKNYFFHPVRANFECDNIHTLFNNIRQKGLYRYMKIPPFTLGKKSTFVVVSLWCSTQTIQLFRAEMISQLIYWSIDAFSSKSEGKLLGPMRIFFSLFAKLNCCLDKTKHFSGTLWLNWYFIQWLLD